MQGVTPSSNALYDGVPLEPPPSNRQGFGRLHLGNSLPLAGSSTSLQVRAAVLDTVTARCKGARVL